MGATCDTTQYDTDVHTISLAADYAATEKLDLRAAVSFSDAKAEWSSLYINYPAGVTDPVLLEMYDPTALSSMTDYSDLHYQQTELSLGGTYQVTPQFYVAAQAAYEIFKDKDPYVYGDLDGESWNGYLGVGYKF